jgi:hypothetical protein
MLPAESKFFIYMGLCVLAAASCLGEVMTKTEAESDAGPAAP